MPRKKKEPEQGFNVFQCQLCTDHPQFDQAGTFSAHLTDVHRMDAKAKYHKRMDRHMDAADWYQTDYTWLNGETEFALQSVRNPRVGEDADYWRVE